MRGKGDGPPQFTTIPVGSVILVSQPSKALGFVEIECDGEELMVYTRDLKERTERVYSN
jgi:uncharacterized protein YraI